MFQNLSDNLTKVLGKLKGKGVLTESDIDLAMREVRIALLEADVALPVVKAFIAAVKEKALGAEVVKSVSPAQMVIKIVQDELTALLGEDVSEIALDAVPPVVVVMAGLQGSGKTTSAGKLALHLKEKRKKKVLLASLDIYRPAAQKQLAILGERTGVDSLPIIEAEKPVAIAKRAEKEAKLGGYDVLILDTAGRLHVDEELMGELKQVCAAVPPKEILLVADSLTGQDAVNVAQAFTEALPLTGVVLTRIDGDGRGGAALSLRHVTGCPIKFVGVGEKPEDFETFHPDRIAARILDMGDIVSLVEKASEAVDQDELKDLEKKIKKGKFDFNDLSKQLGTMKKMGGMGSMLGMMPGIGKMKQKIDEAGLDDSIFNKQQAIISSMTKKERTHPALLNGSRKRRIAAGAGVTVPEVNQLLKQFKQMATMMKKVGKMDKKKLMRSMGGMMPGKRPF